MSKIPRREDLSEDQAAALERAAYLVLSAQKSAAAVLMEYGVEPLANGSWFSSPCGVRLPPPPQNHFCGCRDYSGDGGLCRTVYHDHTGPDIGSGSPIVTCQHEASEHLPS